VTPSAGPRGPVLIFSSRAFRALARGRWPSSLNKKALAAYQLPVFRDHAEVTSAGPTQDVVRELGLLADILNTSGHPIGSPEGRRNKHLGEEGDISRTGRSNVDRHRVSVPHA